jgi:hypothetical protein
MKRSEIYQLDRSRVQRVLGMSDQEYCNAQYEAGLSYLKKFCLGPDSFYFLERSRTFWQWFINQWHIHDYKWLRLCQDNEEVKYEFHDAHEYAAHHLRAMFKGDTAVIYPGTDLVQIARKEVQNECA